MHRENDRTIAVRGGEQMTVLEEAIQAFTGPRAEAYGSPEVNFKNIADLATCLVGREITPRECVLILIAVKLGRLVNTPDHRDSIVDLAGYAAVLARVVGVDIPALIDPKD